MSPHAGSLRSAVSFHSRKQFAAAVAMVSAAVFAPRSVLAVDTIINGGYHAQVTDYFCAAASMEMELDVPAVKGANGAVVQLIGAGDGAPVAHGAAPPAPVINGANQITANGQSFIYGLVHGQNTFNGLNYFNPFTPPGAGTGNTAVAAGLNLIDNPTFNGPPTTPFPAFGNHAYAAYNMANAAFASRTIANALKSTSVPAVAAINHGSHAISVYGVQTDVDPVKNANYKVTGFFVHDPWTGYVFARKKVGDNAPLNAGGWGLGCNTYLRYGYDVVPGMKAIDLPDGTLQPARLGAWFNYFNVAGPQPGEGAVMATPGYKFEVEPIGPELPDDGNGGQFFSLPAPPIEKSEDTASQARTDALNDLIANPTLGSEAGFVGGSFDPNTADEMFLQTPDDITGQGDWVIPYDGAGGANDITGAVAIDADTGVVDMATWIDPSDPNQPHLSLQDLSTMFTDDITAGLLPNDNPTPEPAAMGLLLLVPALMRRRRSA